jgi:hypothetical protein
MTQKSAKAIVVSFLFALTSFSGVQAQDYSLSRLTQSNTNLASGSRFNEQGVGATRFPSDFLDASESAVIVPASRPASPVAVNVAVLAGFASLLTLGGVITGTYFVKQRHRKQNVRVHVVGVQHLSPGRPM